MNIVNEILTALNNVQGISTVLHENPYSANLRIDRLPSPYAIFYTLTDIDISMSLGRFVDAANVEVFFCKPMNIDAKGDATQAIVDEMLVCAKDFLVALKSNNALVLDDNVKVKCAYGKFDKTCCGVSVELQVKAKQPTCFGTAPQPQVLTITENGNYDCRAYNNVVVNISTNDNND